MQQERRFAVARMQADMTAKGWQPSDLADRAGVAPSTVSRFFSGEIQTARVAKKLAVALGYSLRRYLNFKPLAKAS
jgi:transcriptional regulator with XRE-family HTH domain